MKYFFPALRFELLKAFKSRMVWLTTAAFLLGPVMSAFFMFVLKHPQLARSTGLLGEKAAIVGEASWPAFLGLLAQVISVGGFFIFSFLTTWMFGREYADRTIKDLLSLPCPRSIIVAAKFSAIFLVGLLMSVTVITAGITLGFAIGLPEWSLPVFLEGLLTVAHSAMLTIALSTPAAFFASWGQGYLAPLGFTVLMVVLSQIIAAIGYGAYFPWSIPALSSGVTGTSMPLGLGDIAIVLAASLCGICATLAWYIFADQQ